MSKKQWGHGHRTGIVEGEKIGWDRGQCVGAYKLATKVNALVKACFDAYATDRNIDMLTLLHLIKDEAYKHLPAEDLKDYNQKFFGGGE